MICYQIRSVDGEDEEGEVDKMDKVDREDGEDMVGEEDKDVQATVLNTNFWGHAKKMRKENVVSDTKEKNSKQLSSRH